MSSTDNRILLHVLKHNPQDGEVYITWAGETFLGQLTKITVETSVDSFTKFEIGGFVVHPR